LAGGLVVGVVLAGRPVVVVVARGDNVVGTAVVVVVSTSLAR
jgi:hypothetical protein